MSASKAVTPEPNSTQALINETSLQYTEDTTRSSQNGLQAKVRILKNSLSSIYLFFTETIPQVAEREEYRCAITGTFDLACVHTLIEWGQRKEIPLGLQHLMEVTYIMPLLLKIFGKIS